MTQLKERRAVLYVRVSTRPQDRTASREVQIERMTNYADGEGILIGRIFGDVGSGLSIKERPEFDAFTDYICDPANKITDVIFDDMSRFTRSPRDYFPYMDRIEKAGVTLHSVLEGEKIGSDSDFTWGMICLNNERSSRITSNKTKNHQRAAVRHGQPITGKIPYGYMGEHAEREIETSRGKKTIAQNHFVPNPEEWPHLLKIFSMALNGSSPMTTARELNLLGIPGPGGEWSDRTIRYVLRNPHYLGRPYRGRNPKSKLPGRQESLPTIYGPEGTHQAAVSEEDFERIEQMIVARTRTSGPTKSHSSVNILSGKAICGQCRTDEHEYTLVIHRDRPGSPPKLRCSKKKNQGASECPSEIIPMDALVKIVLERMLGKILTEEQVRKLIEDVARDSRKYLAEGQKRKAQLSAHLADTKKRIQNLSEVLQTLETRTETPIIPKPSFS